MSDSNLLDRINTDVIADIDSKYNICHNTLTNAIHMHLPIKWLQPDPATHQGVVCVAIRNTYSNMYVQFFFI